MGKALDSVLVFTRETRNPFELILWIVDILRISAEEVCQRASLLFFMARKVIVYMYIFK